jgi:phosphopantothenoylcysteine synthetase/decarboxylase
MKNILITAGGTREYIDDVRVMTNISSGKLGAQIALDVSHMEDTLVHFVHGVGSVLPESIGLANMSRITYYEVKTAQDTMDTMIDIILKKNIDVVIHSMAVSDFTFKREENIKIKSNKPEDLVEFMRMNITPNPKIINHIKKWKPEVHLIGFKFEVGIPFEDLKILAEKSIKDNGCDLVIANDKEEMKRMKEHVAHFIFSKEISSEYGITGGMVFGKSEISKKITHFLNRIF